MQWRGVLSCLTLLSVFLGGPVMASPQPMPSVTTVPQPTPVEHEAVHGEPDISDIKWLASPQVHPGSIVDATVFTTDNVVYVEARYKVWNLIFQTVGPGQFHLRYRVPFLPPWAIGTWPISVIARSVDGVEVKRVYVFHYRYF